MRRILDEGFVPIVMLRAYGYGELISRAADARVIGFVVQPFKESALIEALRDRCSKPRTRPRSATSAAHRGTDAKIGA